MAQSADAMAECLGEPDFSSPRVWTHRSEFPAEYSLAGCSPAEPASASSAVLILNLATPSSPPIFGELQLSPQRTVSKPHSHQRPRSIARNVPTAFLITFW